MSEINKPSQHTPKERTEMTIQAIANAIKEYDEIHNLLSDIFELSPDPEVATSGRFNELLDQLIWKMMEIEDLKNQLGEQRLREILTAKNIMEYAVTLKTHAN